MEHLLDISEVSIKAALSVFSVFTFLVAVKSCFNLTFTLLQLSELECKYYERQRQQGGLDELLFLKHDPHLIPGSKHRFVCLLFLLLNQGFVIFIA